MSDSEYTSVDIKDFFDEKEVINKDDFDTGIVVFTEKQTELVRDLRATLEKNDPEHFNLVNKQVQRLKELNAAIANFPSLLERSNLTVGSRTPQSLIESLINTSRDVDSILQLPSKATLGKGFLVSKLHTFASFEKLSKLSDCDEKLTKALRAETVSMMFLLLAEDVYINLIHDTSLSMDSRRQLALSLLLLWEHRADQNISDISPVLQSVWLARSRLAPAFGTMMGTSELIMLSFQLDDQWSEFIKTKLSIQDVSMAMEEFLFGISYEQVTTLKQLLRDRGISAIGRDEVSSFLGGNVKTDVSQDYRDFYQQYTLRRDNARTRERMNLPGPHKTLEDHFISFVMEKNRETQERDLEKDIVLSAKA